MKNTLADVRQLFNVKELAPSGLSPAAMLDDTFGIINEATNLTVLPSDFASLPDSFRFVSKLGGRVWQSAGTIAKSCIGDRTKKPYKAGQREEWRATIAHCGCIRGVGLGIHIEDDLLLRSHGMTWADRDVLFEVTRPELDCGCRNGKPHEVYENHVATLLLFRKIKAAGSPFYDAYVEDESGTYYSDVASVEAFVAANKAVNTDGDDTNDSDGWCCTSSAGCAPRAATTTLR